MRNTSEDFFIFELWKIIEIENFVRNIVRVSKNLVDALLMEFVKNMKIIKTKIHDEKAFRHLARLLARKEVFCGIIGWVMLAMVAIESTSDEPIFSFEVNMK